MTSRATIGAMGGQILKLLILVAVGVVGCAVAASTGPELPVALAEFRCDEGFAAHDGVCWSRCPLGQEWDGDGCNGERLLGIPLAEAEEGCTKLGPGCELPQKSEVVDLFDGCDQNARGNGTGTCLPCAKSKKCNALYGTSIDDMGFWALDEYVRSSNATWVIFFSEGVVTMRMNSLPGPDPVGAVCVCRCPSR